MPHRTSTGQAVANASSYVTGGNADLYVLLGVETGNTQQNCICNLWHSHRFSSPGIHVIPSWVLAGPTEQNPAKVTEYHFWDYVTKRLWLRPRPVLLTLMEASFQAVSCSVDSHGTAGRLPPPAGEGPGSSAQQSGVSLGVGSDATTTLAVPWLQPGRDVEPVAQLSHVQIPDLHVLRGDECWLF